MTDGKYQTFPLPPLTYKNVGITPVENHCYLCGKLIRSKVQYQIHIVNGGFEVLSTAQEEEYSQDVTQQASDLGGHLLGPDCPKKIPKEYLIKIKVTSKKEEEHE